jgi:hypothetical protein
VRDTPTLLPDRVRHTLTEALLGLPEGDRQSEMERQMASVLAVLTEFREKLEPLQQRGVVETDEHRQQPEERVSVAFINSVKSAA